MSSQDQHLRSATTAVNRQKLNIDIESADALKKILKAVILYIFDMEKAIFKFLFNIFWSFFSFMSEIILLKNLVYFFNQKLNDFAYTK